MILDWVEKNEIAVKKAVGGSMYRAVHTVEDYMETRRKWLLSTGPKSRHQVASEKFQIEKPKNIFLNLEPNPISFSAGSA